MATQRKERNMHGIKGIGITLLLMLAMTSAVFAQESSVLLEKAIYSEETLGNLSEAISIYQQIVGKADTSRNTAALALYRLGMCYRKSGNEDQARAAFNRLAQQYPEQKDLILKSQMLDLRPAPWVDGEILRMGTKSIGAKDVMGVIVYRAESTQQAGKTAWNFRQVMAMTSLSIYQAAVVNAGNYLPISSRYRVNFMGTDVEATYAPDQIQLSSLQNGVKTDSRIPLNGIVYDNWQLLHLIRCLPLREGFQVIIPVSLSGVLDNVNVSVVGKETITVPAGTFDCYKTVIAPPNNAQEQTIWFSTDGHVYPVKVIQGGVSEQELNSIEVVGKNQPVYFEDGGSGITMSLPSQWYFGRTIPGGLNSLSAPELDSILLLYSWAYKPEDEIVTRILDKWIERHKEQTPAYQVRPETREAVTIAGFDGECYVADTKNPSTGEPTVDFNYSFTTPLKKYVFVFQTNKDNFDKMKPAFESIMSTVGIK
jgi:tetratricopeptide (TPR) repeat protein